MEEVQAALEELALEKERLQRRNADLQAELQARTALTVWLGCNVTVPHAALAAGRAAAQVAPVLGCPSEGRGLRKLRCAGHGPRLNCQWLLARPHAPGAQGCNPVMLNVSCALRQAEEEELRILRAAEECAPPAPAEEVGAPCFSGDITLTVKGPAVTLSPEQARTPPTARVPRVFCCCQGELRVVWEPAKSARVTPFAPAPH